jgi:hypothetical protein
MRDRGVAAPFAYGEIKMPSCSCCGNMILFGGVKQGELRFCNATCQSNGYLLWAASVVPEDAVRNLADKIHRGPCPRCQGDGPVDAHFVHWVWSALALTRWGSRQLVACRGCALKSQFGNLAFSAGLGWWGFPWGFLCTPVQIVRNIKAMASPPDPSQPSANLIQVARVRLASQAQAKPCANGLTTSADH